MAEEEINSTDEDAIYKSLTHQIRRQIIKLFGEDSTFAFSDIKKKLDPIDSSMLAYHLKSLQTIIIQEEGKYKLSKIGIAALNLISNVDQTTYIKWYQRKFWLAHIITIICWIVVETFVPLAYYAPLGAWSFGLIQIIINGTAIINQIVLGLLRRQFYSSKFPNK
jgi:hypothetical protein